MKHLPAASSSTDDGNGGASKSDISGQVAKNNTKKASEQANDRVRGRLNSVAALNRTGAAATSRLAPRERRGGDRESSEGGGDEG